MKRDWFKETGAASVLVDESGTEWVELEQLPKAIPVQILRRVLDDYYRASPDHRSLGICKTLEHLIDEAQSSDQASEPLKPL